ncbi:hypothetical protein LZ32DRAFT_462356 [Colletotrichum eremochloae]|nr:hypothetical protein LZ32DRAFT_462356 [Colletotrichum eremochloae]
MRIDGLQCARRGCLSTRPVLPFPLGFASIAGPSCRGVAMSLGCAPVCGSVLLGRAVRFFWLTHSLRYHSNIWDPHSGLGSMVLIDCK